MRVVGGIAQETRQMHCQQKKETHAKALSIRISLDVNRRGDKINK